MSTVPPEDGVVPPLERIATALEDLLGTTERLIEAIEGIEIPAGVDGDDTERLERVVRTGFADLERAVRREGNW